MNQPTVAGRGPIAVDVEAGSTYYWCSCGLSTTQPFCSGAHKGSGFTPVAYCRAQRPGLLLRLQAFRQAAAVRRHAQDLALNRTTAACT